MTALEYLQSKGLPYTMQAGQAVLNCPFCGKEKHFYLDPTEGAFFCHKCNEAGNLVTLRHHLGDSGNGHGNGHRKPQGAVTAAFQNKDKAHATPSEKDAETAHRRLLSDAEAMSYLQDRTITRETIEAFRLGLEVDRSGKRWLTIPHFEKGQLVNVKSRTLPPAEKTFRRVKGCKSILFNSDVIEKNRAEVYLCEGETDALTLHSAGIKNAIATTTGAGSFDAEWIDRLQDVKKVILIYDSDEPGQKGAREVARRLGYDRVFNVVLPDGQDVNDFFQAGNNLTDFIQYVAGNARRFDVAGILTFDEGLKRLQESEQDREAGIRTGFADVDRIIKTGFLPGELVVLSAPPKIGKSTFALQVVTYNALIETPSLFFCLEMRPVKVIQKVVQCHARQEATGEAEFEKARQAFKGKPLYLGYSHQRPTLDGVMTTLKAAIRRYGLKLVVFDHLHFLCRSISNQTQEIGQAVQAFKFLAEELEVPVILIAQPRKTNPDAIMTAMDLKDSASIFSDCDHLLIMHRARRKGTGGDLASEAFDPVTMVRVEASRYSAGGEALLYYKGECSRFERIHK
jgi:twinkle protein